MPGATLARLPVGRVSPARSAGQHPAWAGGDGWPHTWGCMVNLVKSTESSPYMCAADTEGLKKRTLGKRLKRETPLLQRLPIWYVVSVYC